MNKEVLEGRDVGETNISLLLMNKYNETDLKNFYERFVWQEGLGPFEKLSDDDKNYWAKSDSYRRYLLTKASDDFNTSVKKAFIEDLKKIRSWLRRLFGKGD